VLLVKFRSSIRTNFGKHQFVESESVSFNKG
jgi:hypothetical protein